MKTAPEALRTWVWTRFLCSEGAHKKMCCQVWRLFSYITQHNDGVYTPQIEAKTCEMFDPQRRVVLWLNFIIDGDNGAKGRTSGGEIGSEAPCKLRNQSVWAVKHRQTAHTQWECWYSKHLRCRFADLSCVILQSLEKLEVKSCFALVCVLIC